MSGEDDDIQFSLGLEEKETKSRFAPEPEDKESGEVLEWVCHPARRSKRTTIIVSVFIALLVIVVYYATYSVWFTILAFLILTGSLAGYYFPTRYRFTGKEIIVKTTMQTLHKKWSQYRSFYPDKNGVLLSPFVRPSRLENFRGIYIKFWNNRDEVLTFVREKIKRDNQNGGKES